MKKSILILALPCLMALTLTVEKVFATDEVVTVFSCEPADIICYEWYFWGGKMGEVKGEAVFNTTIEDPHDEPIFPCCIK